MERTYVTKGAIVTWDWMPRDGWGCTFPVPAVVTRIGQNRVRIEVIRDDGKTVAKWVKPSTLFPYVQEEICEVPI